MPTRVQQGHERKGGAQNAIVRIPVPTLKLQTACFLQVFRIRRGTTIEWPKQLADACLPMLAVLEQHLAATLDGAHSY